MTSTDDLRFVVDTMLGDLARWLRILGYDTKYSRNYEDWELLRIASNEKRVLLTRDRGLYWRARRKGIEAVLVEEDDIVERLLRVAKTYGIRLYVDSDKTRCTVCNSPLLKVDRERVKDKVPRKVYEKYRDFWICPRCGKVYWRGRHWVKIEEILAIVRDRLNGGKETRSPKRTSIRRRSIPRKTS